MKKVKSIYRLLVVLFVSVLLFVPGSFTKNVNAASNPGITSLSKIQATSYNKIKIQWKRASGATNYVIYYKKYGTSKWTRVSTVSSSATSYTHTASGKYPITIGQKYTYTVRAYNKNTKKYGAYNSRGLTTYTVPDMATLNTPQYDSTSGNMTVKWNKAAGATHYAIFHKTSSSQSWKRIATVYKNCTSYIDKNVKKGVTHYYTVRSYNSTGKVYGRYNNNGVRLRVELPANVKISNIVIQEFSQDFLEKGKTYKANVEIFPSNATNKNLEWFSYTPDVLKVDSNGNITAVGLGYGVFSCAATDGSNIEVSYGICVRPPVRTAAEYKYEIEILNKHPLITEGSSGYMPMSFVLVYIKTDNPNPYRMNLKIGDDGRIYGMTYDDVRYTSNSSVNGFYSVNGGYLCNIMYSEAGNKKLEVIEYEEENTYSWYDPGIVAAQKTITVNDFTTIEKAWMQQVINQVTNSSMNDYQKMQAIETYILKNFRYSSGMNGYVVYLLADQGAYFHTRMLECTEAARMMSRFATLLGLKSEVVYAGYLNHHNTKVWIDGEEYIFDACPYSDTGEISEIRYVL